MTGPYPLPVLLEMLREPCGDDDCGHCQIERQAADEIEQLELNLRDVINAAESAGWNGVENSKLLTGFIAGMKAEIERLRTILSTPPTWLCHDCRNQWIMRDEAEKQPAPVFTDNRDAKPLPPRQGPNGRLLCPGQNCANILNRHTPRQCPDCLQPIEKPK